MEKIQLPPIPIQIGKFSFFNSPITNKIPFKEMDLFELWQKIISNEYLKETNILRQIKEKPEFDKFKINNFNWVTFSGIFNNSQAKSLKSHSNLFCIDIDKISNVYEVKNLLINEFAPALLFISPSGKGLKLIYKIDIKQASHFEYFKSFETFFKSKFNLIIDDKCKNVNRACFICYDNDAYYNNDAVAIDISTIKCSDNGEGKLHKEEVVTDETEIIKKLKTWLNKSESFSNGNRNNYVSQLAAAFNRYGIIEKTALTELLSFVEIDFTTSEITSIVKSIYSQTEWYNTAKFEESIPLEFNKSTISEKPTPLFPINGFPEFLQNYINEYVKVYNVPRDYIAASVFFSTALAIGNKLQLQSKYKNVPVFWMAIVGNVSTGKTEPLNNALSYFTLKDTNAFKEYKYELEVFNIEQEKSKKERDISISRPKLFQYILNDYTPESLASVHETNSRGLCIYRDELKGWFDDFGRYSKSGEQSNMLSSYYGLTMLFNRAGKEPLCIKNSCIFVAGGLQPELLKTLAQDSRAENGFLSRLGFIYPDEQIKQDYSDNELEEGLIIQYHEYLDSLATIEEQIQLKLSKAATKTYECWFNNNAKISNLEPSGYLKGVYGKLDVFLLRIAIVLHGMNFVCNNDAEDEIQQSTMEFATEITEYFRETALKVYGKIFIENGNTKLNKKEVIKYCSSLGATQNEIANATKVSQQYVQKILTMK